MTDHDLTDKALARAVGEELRRAREERGWSRGHLVARLPSGIGERTLLSYEHGTRQLTVSRLNEICYTLGVCAADLLAYALQRARIYINNLALSVDLHALLNDDTAAFRPMHQWAQNRLNRHPDGIANVAPASVQEIADFIGCPTGDLASYLAQFLPEMRPMATISTGSTATIVGRCSAL